MTEKTFTIITVVRNDLTGFNLTKASLEAQTFNDWEWIIVDGASTDGTAELVLAICDPRVKAISERDQGIYDAMNKGLKAASGTYVLLMNAGDCFYDQSVLDAAKRELDTDADVLFGGSIMRFGDINVRRAPRKLSYIWHGQPGIHQATFFRRETHLRFQYDRKYKICGDYDVIARMWMDGCQFRTCPLLVNVNDFQSKGASSTHKLRLAFEAAQIQRRVLNMSFAAIGCSVIARLITSTAHRSLTYVSAFLSSTRAAKAL